MVEGKVVGGLVEEVTLNSSSGGEALNVKVLARRVSECREASHSEAVDPFRPHL